MHRIIRIAGASLAVVVLALAGLVSLSPPVGAEPTGGCRPVGGGPVTTAGPHRATVVVDTGSGPVWSACVTFDGTISGIEALALASAAIPGLAPVYEPYPGQGRAVCRLLGVGNDPPDCLGKSVEYWSYFRNGAYARGGGSSSVVSDGDVEGWSFSRGTAPRTATAGTEAVPASAIPTTAPPTTAPPPATDPAPTTVPVGPDPVGPAPSTPSGPDQGAAPSTPDAGPTSGAPGAPGGDHAAGSNPDAPSDTEGGPAALRPAPGGGNGDGGGQSGSGSVALTEPVGSGGSGSSMTSVLGFGAALGSVGVATLLVRRRRLALHTAPAGVRLGPDAPP